MIYNLEIRARAENDFDAIPPRDAARISRRIATLTHDVKRLTNFTPSYRLRVGDWRVLFEVVNQTVVVHRVLHRREAYR